MKEFLNMIGDIRVVIAIAVIVVLLVIWLIIQRVNTKHFRSELSELEETYKRIKGIPVSLKMNKAVAIGRVDQETVNRVNDAQNLFDSTQADLSKIAQSLADAEDLITVGKLKKAGTLMDMLETQLKVADSQVQSLEITLDEILAKETAQRQEVTALKNRFRALKSQAQENASRMSFGWPMLEQKVSDTEKMFSTFEEWMFSNDFDKANQELVSIRTSLDELDMMLDKMPGLIEDARGIVPKMAESLHQDYVKARKHGVYLKHLDVENNLKVMSEALKDDLKKLRAGSTDGVQEHLDDYKQRIRQMEEAVKNETASFDEIRRLVAETEETSAEANKCLEAVKEAYAKNAVRFGLDSMSDSLTAQSDALEQLNEKKPSVIENTNNYQVPASTIVDSLRTLNRSYADAAEALKDMRTKLDIATGDEDRARKQLIKLQIIMNQMQVRIRKFKLPNISETYQEDLRKGNEYIRRIQDLINEVPMNIQLLNATLQEALNFIYQLYNNVNNVVGTVVMVENTIVFGNRYRSTYADIDSELTRSELCFRNGEYTQALTIAIATIEKIHPGNYESMIKENAKSAR